MELLYFGQERMEIKPMRQVVSCNPADSWSSFRFHGTISTRYKTSNSQLRRRDARAIGGGHRSFQPTVLAIAWLDKQVRNKLGSNNQCDVSAITGRIGLNPIQKERTMQDARCVIRSVQRRLLFAPSMEERTSISEHHSTFLCN